MAEAKPSVLDQYNDFQNSGLLYRVEDLKQENRDLNRAIEDIAHLVSYTHVETMINYLVKMLNNYFIPQSMCFFVQPPRGGALRQYFYTNLKPSETRLSERNFKILKAYFEALNITSTNGFAHPFDSIKDFITDIIPQDLLDLNPKYIIPLFGIGGVFSIVLLSEKATEQAYSFSELSYIHRIFSVLSVTMQNGLHYEVSITEPKTGLYTYDYFKTRVEECISTCRRYNRTAAMMIIDIDFFKHFNDTYGHLCGDKVLVALAKTLKHTVRDNDCVARFGGEEFSILLTECDPKYVFNVCERIRKEIEKIELIEKAVPLKITASIGAFLIDNKRGLTPTYIFKKADDALYFSKQHGRNRSTIYKLGLLEAAELLLGNIPEES